MLTSTVGVYPDDALSPIIEDEGLKSEPEKNQRGYGWAKRIGELQCKMYSDEFGMKISIIRPDNTFGPRDNFDSKQSRVIPSLIKKTIEAKKELIVWGSGNQKRTFVYACKNARKDFT